MCIIAWVPKSQGKNLLDKYLKNCFENNPDGAGFVVKNKDKTLFKAKGLFTFDAFMNAYEEHRDKEALLHFRIKTHGKIDEENTHPFWVVEDKLAFVHNGVLPIDTKADESKSDTWHFNEVVLKPLAENFSREFINKESIQMLISGYIGSSKLAFMQEGKGNTWLFNEDKGQYEDKIWFSNNSYKWLRSTSTTEFTTSKSYPSGGLLTVVENSKKDKRKLCLGDIVSLQCDIPSVGNRGEFAEVIETKDYTQSLYVRIYICSELGAYKRIATALVPDYKLCLEVPSLIVEKNETGQEHFLVS